MQLAWKDGPRVKRPPGYKKDPRCSRPQGKLKYSAKRTIVFSTRFLSLSNSFFSLWFKWFKKIRSF